MLKRMKKHEDKEHRKTLKHEATQNKNSPGSTALERSEADTPGGGCVYGGGGRVKIFLSVDKLHPGSRYVS